MFFEPNRKQAIKIQKRLRSLYEEEIGGKYFSGEEAWNIIEKLTEINLKEIICKIVKEKTEVN